MISFIYWLWLVFVDEGILERDALIITGLLELVIEMAFIKVLVEGIVK